MLRLTLFVLVVLSLAIPTGAFAYPVLQLYIDGATYDPVTETWTTTSSPFNLWVIGDGKFGTIYEVKLSMAFFGAGGSVTIMPTTTGLVVDPSSPPPPSLWSFGTGTNEPLPDHGVFNDPALNGWENWLLGDFDLTDSPIGDFTTAFPTTFNSTGQINVYSIAILGWERVHFDAFDHTLMTPCNPMKGCEKQWIAPFSHDASHSVPEPSSLALLVLGGAALVALRARRGRSRQTR